MQIAKTLRSRVQAGETLLGCFLTWPTGGVAELLALAGFDFVLLDTEHGVFSPDSLVSTLAACDGAGIPAMVRVPSSPSLEAARCLDYGAAGILFPRAENVQAVRAAVEMVKYPPDGKRGLAGVRANKYAVRPLAQYVVEANEETMVAVQIETSGGLSDARSICAEKYVDVLYVGPNDLTQALGVPGQYQHKTYQEAIARIATATRDAGKAAGIMLAKTEQIAPLRKLGYRFFTTSDRVVILESARAWRAAFQSS
ncbi:MAG TPA: aldolase/citrate lyase family protein [Myxococcaceae bacterium]|nr:aldolase/citrate lyase family protein [Myxococcaceae bacterium]